MVENVFIVDSSISNGVDELGAFAGNLKNSTIRKSASVNVSVKGLVAVGGMVGKTNAGAVIDNCYVTGKVQGTYDHPTLGARVGGIAGWHGGGEIKNSFTQVQVIAPAMKGNGRPHRRTQYGKPRNRKLSEHERWGWVPDRRL